jgi:hypothetical protein
VSYRWCTGRWERSPARRHLAGLSAAAAGPTRGCRCGRCRRQGLTSRAWRAAADTNGGPSRSAAGRGKAIAGLSELADAAHEEGEKDATADAGGTSLPSAGGTHGKIRRR